MDFTYDTEQNALRDAVRGLLEGLRRRAAPRGRRERPRLRREDLVPAGRDGPARACRSARTTAAWAPDRSRWRSWPRRSAGSSPPSRSSRPSCSPAAWWPPWAPPSSAPEVLGRDLRGQPRARLRPRRARHPLVARPPPAVTATRRRRRLDALRRQGAGAAAAPAPTCSWSAPRSDGATRLFLVRRRREGLTRTGYRTHDGSRAARVDLRRHPGHGRWASGDADRRALERALAAARIAYATRPSAPWTRRCG